MATDSTQTRTRIILIGIGGSTNSGKTTLAKHLKTCLPNSFIIHQDDFAPPVEQLPIHPELGVPDWDNAPGAIDWDRLVDFLNDVKRTGTLPEGHQSYDDSNITPSVPASEDVITHWRSWGQNFAADHLRRYGETLSWAIMDGFLVFWDERVVSNLDVQVFIRTPEAVIRKRREDRPYVTAEGEVWRDPPQYWEKVVWPAYIHAHQHLFENGDVVNGRLSKEAGNLILFDSTEVEMGTMVDEAMKRVMEVSEAVHL